MCAKAIRRNRYFLFSFVCKHFSFDYNYLNVFVDVYKNTLKVHKKKCRN